MPHLWNVICKNAFLKISFFAHLALATGGKLGFKVFD